MLVRESVSSFQRGQDPKKALGIGNLFFGFTKDLLGLEANNGINKLYVTDDYIQNNKNLNIYYSNKRAQFIKYNEIVIIIDNEFFYIEFRRIIFLNPKRILWKIVGSSSRIAFHKELEMFETGQLSRSETKKALEKIYNYFLESLTKNI